MLSEFHQTPQQVNESWTEEQIALYFRKRNQRLKRLAAEIEKTRTESVEESTVEPRKVTNDELFARMNAMRAKGGGISITRVN